MTRTPFACWVAFIVAFASPLVARAEPTEQERTLANALFDEGRRLMTAGRYAEACPKLAESQRLQPGGGTLLNLGLCHDKEGRLASAWGELRAALAIARRDGRSDREAIALERIAAIEPELSTLTIEVAETSRVVGLVVRVDDLPLGPAAWSLPQPIDGGEHLIRAEAPGYEAWSTPARVEERRGRLQVQVPRLVPLPAETQKKPAAHGGATPAIVPKARASGDQRLGAWVAGGVGLAAVTAGSALALAALAEGATADEGCPPGGDVCTQEGADASDRALTLADLATSAFVVGGLSIGLGAALWLTAADPPTSPGTSALDVRVGAGAVRLRGSF